MTDSNPVAAPVTGQARGARQCRVVSVERDTPDSVRVLIADESGEPFNFEPGQFFMVNVEIDGQLVRRTYSATNAPGEFDGGLRIAVKRRAGGLVSNYINDRLRAGDRLVLKGPGGKFVPSPATGARHIVLIAGGSGVTPMISMARTLPACDASISITLLYGNRNLSDVMFLAELNDLVSRWGGRFNVVHVLSDAEPGWSGLRGILNRDMLAEVLGTMPAGDEFLVCGAPGMMESVRNSLISLGVDGARVRTETFNVPEDL